MLAGMKYACALIGSYAIAWTFAYVLLMGFDFDYYLEYFGYAWTFNGGELPTFIWFFSLVAFVPLAIVVIVLVYRRDQRERSATTA